ncbi:MAG: RepB family plasmid replication initiator protein [Candidatus Electrothrix sp. AX1]|nr:RepB family plasmid replication initiator protein [Candidatus Electrothrix sp. AX1]
MGLRKCFTIVPLTHIKGLRSQYSVRIYMLLRQYRNLGRFDLAVNDFRKMLDLENKYKRFNELRRWVLDVARKELDAKAELSFTLETVRKGKTISTLKFTIVRKQKTAKKSRGTHIEQVLKTLFFK